MDAMAQAASPEAIADYQRRLAEYQEARAAFDAEAGAYWKAIADKRRGRNAKRRDHVQITLDDYVLEQPPVYAGPKRPVNPEPEPERRAARAEIYPGRRRPAAGRRATSSNGCRNGRPTTSISSAPMRALPQRQG